MGSRRSAFATKTGVPHRRDRAGPQPRPKGKRWRRSPWYRRSRTWRWALGIGAVGALVTLVLLSGSPGGGGRSTGAPYVGGDLHSLVFDPSAPSRLYVGGHDGVAVSTDGGRTWRSVGSLSGADAMGWAFSDGRVLVGGHPGLFVSGDGGRSFEMRNEGLPATDVHALGAAGDAVVAGSPAVGIFASTDGGQTWGIRTEQAGQSFMGRILVDPDDPQHLVAPDMQAGAVESTDGGRTWRQLGGVAGAMWVTWDPADTEHIVVSGMGQAARSTDGGATWTPISVPAGASVVEMPPDDPGVLYAAALVGTEAEVSVSRDGGATWTTP